MEDCRSFFKLFLKDDAFLAAALTRTLLDLGFGGEEGGEYFTFSAVAWREGTERDRRDLFPLEPRAVGTCSDFLTAVLCLTMLVEEYSIKRGEKVDITMSPNRKMPVVSVLVKR